MTSCRFAARTMCVMTELTGALPMLPGGRDLRVTKSSPDARQACRTLRNELQLQLLAVRLLLLDAGRAHAHSGLDSTEIG